MKKNIISIIIATKNRQKYALNAVQSILSINSADFEVVVQDNSDDTSLAKFLEKYNEDCRLVYNYTSANYSFIDNFNEAIEMSSGDYLCLIGDDDGINPEVITAANWARDNNIDALTGNLAANYRWAGTGAPNTFFTKMTDDTLVIQYFNGRATKIDLEEILSNLMKNGCTNYIEFPMPKLYHGVIKRELLTTIKQNTGAFLKGLSPDIYASIALACTAKSFVYIDYPLTIPGVCAESGSIKEGQLKNHSKKLEDAPHFKNRNSAYSWSEQIPRIFCVQTIWADSGIAALREMKRNDLIDKIDLYKLYALIIDSDKSLKGMVINHIKLINNGKFTIKNKLKFFKSYLSGPLKKFIVKRVIGRTLIILRIHKLKNITEIKDIFSAMIVLQKYLSNKSKINFLSELKKINL